MKPVGKNRTDKWCKNVRKITSAEVVVPYQEDVYGKYYKEFYQSRYSPGNYEEDMELYQKEPENDYFTSRFISVDEEGFFHMQEHISKKVVT